MPGSPSIPAPARNGRVRLLSVRSLLLQAVAVHSARTLDRTQGSSAPSMSAGGPACKTGGRALRQERPDPKRSPREKCDCLRWTPEGFRDVLRNLSQSRAFQRGAD
eukprot:CAMPEP_0114488570 /NCGR_PEP_ID=MMETSP0109-20121206/1405_1 /TAXON_ID=29199 /ORGANISM="Chlorarachnion reptans, Strain CCCM449" /LENGTH=105 /DNA_ID=CAMNT_0001664981 /DNA_START=768 /DNA_END=1085 /DNA_ORIENTATION=+